MKSFIGYWLRYNSWCQLFFASMYATLVGLINRVFDCCFPFGLSKRQQRASGNNQQQLHCISKIPEEMKRT